MPQLVLPDFAPQLVWLLITFVLLYVIMVRVALPRIGTVIEHRRDRIASDRDKAEKLKAETEQAIAAYEQALAEARAKAHAIAQETREKLSAQVERDRAKIEKQIAEKTAEAETRIQASKAAALTQVNAIAAETAEAIVKQLIGGQLTKADIDDAVGKTLTN